MMQRSAAKASRFLASVLIAGLIVGCNREDGQAIRVQQVPKRPPPSAMSPAAPMMSANEADQTALPPGHPQIPAGVEPGAARGSAVPASGQITYAAPPGWTRDGPMSLRYVSFHLGQGQAQTDLIVSQLEASGSASRLANINRWRGQVGLAALGENEAQPSKAMTVGGEEGAVFDLLGPADGNLPQRRLIVAWVPKGNQWWFFKIIGPVNEVARQQTNFENFLKSVQFVSEKL